MANIVKTLEQVKKDAERITLKRIREFREQQLEQQGAEVAIDLDVKPAEVKAKKEDK
jgi:hypothetical protein